MNTTLDSTRLTKLHELDSLLPREIRGQSHALPHIVSTLKHLKAGARFSDEESLRDALESKWVGDVPRYGARREEIAAVVIGLLEEHNVVFESRQAVWPALNDYLDALPVGTASGIRVADLADALVVE